MNKNYRIIIGLLLFTMLYSCRNEQQSPRPFGYFRIDTPPHKYKNTDLDCPFQFKYSEQAKIIIMDKQKCWLNIYYPKHKATIYLTYIKLNGDLKENIDNTQKLTYEHQIKATKIERIPVSFPDKKVFGLQFKLGGEVASSRQFYLTDSTSNYIRGSLYFDAMVNSDSLKPVIKYMDIDIQEFINSFEWK